MFDKEISMNGTLRVMPLAVIAALVLLAVPLAAQQGAEPLGKADSQTSTVTQGLFGTAVDDFFDYHYYGDVEFGSWFGYAGYVENTAAGSTTPSRLLSLGYARKFGGLYLGLNYAGNLFASDNDKTETIGATYDGNGVNTTTVTEETLTKKEFTPRNEIGALLGIGGMGIKVGFAENLKIEGSPSGSTFNKVTKHPGNPLVQYSNMVDTFSSVQGGLIPWLGWGMSMDLGGISLRPKAELSFLIYQDKRESILKSYDTLGETITGVETWTLSGDNKSQNYLKPGVTLGAMATLAKNNGFEVQAGLEYSLGLKLYDNSYDLFGFSGSTSGKVTIDTTTAGDNTQSIGKGLWGNAETRKIKVSLTEESASSHTISPALVVYKEFDERLNVGFSFIPVISLDFTSTQSWTESHSVTLSAPTGQGLKGITTTVEDISGKTDEAVSIVSVMPELAAGLTYAVVPDRFKVNLGLGATFGYEDISTRTKPSGTGSKKTTVVDAQGNTTTTIDVSSGLSTTSEDTLKIESGWQGLKPQVGAGFTLIMGSNASLDVGLNINTTNNFGASLNNLSLQFTLKK
jgi:hypothetical protein